MLTNRIKAKYNIEEIDKDFDIFEVSSDSEKDIDKNILDINTDDKRYNARSVVYTWGKTCFMMFDKGYMTDVILRSIFEKSGADGYLVGKYRADGVLISTPSGSTAYALSAGGPVIEPDLECIEMTLICPHSLFSRATLFSCGRKLRITDKTSGDESMVISIDGDLYRKLGENDSIEIVRGKNNVKFINLIGNSFHESLCRKLCRPIK